MTARDKDLARSLATIARRAEQLRVEWVGTRETGVNPNTGDALVSRGWVDRKGGGPGRLMYRVTGTGRRILEQLDEEG